MEAKTNLAQNLAKPIGARVTLEAANRNEKLSNMHSIVRAEIEEAKRNPNKTKFERMDDWTQDTPHVRPDYSLDTQCQPS